MTTHPEHDFEAALECLDNIINPPEVIRECLGSYAIAYVAANHQTIRHALRLAAKVIGEPSEGMQDEGFKALTTMSATDKWRDGNGSAFKAMIEQAIKEIN